MHYKEYSEISEDMESENIEKSESLESMDNTDHLEISEIIKNNVKMKVKIDEDYNLIFESKSGRNYEGDKLFAVLITENNKSKLAKNIATLEYSKIFELEGEIIILARFALKCNFETINSKTVYSLDHLDLIFKSLKYSSPYCTSNRYENYIPLNDLNSKWNIFIEKEINIENLMFDKQKACQIFTEQTNLINEYIKLNHEKDKFLYKILSYNLNKYLELNPKNDLNQTFYYVDSEERRQLESYIKHFIKDKTNFIFRVLGPYGIGKSVTSLIIQKQLYKKCYKTIYINLKFYSKEISWDIKLDVLLSELFFLCDDINEYELLYEKLLKNKSKNIWNYLMILYKYIKEQEKLKQKKLSNYLFIIDQYKINYDTNSYILKFPKLHIFALSSINDRDIKKSLILALKDKTKNIKYLYIQKLIQNTVYNILNNYKEIVIKKLPNTDSINDDEKYNFISNILNLFGNLPRFISLLINKYLIY